MDFYVRYSYKRLQFDTSNLLTTYAMNGQLDSVYYPWNRTFEIGLLASIADLSLRWS
jgi:hypothetical protein